MQTNIAVTIWGNRISPVFDAASTLLIVSVKGKQIVHRDYKRVDFEELPSGFAVFEQCGVDTLICGAITQDQSDYIKRRNICLIPFISGQTEKVLDTYLNRDACLSNYLMPGTDLPDRAE